LYLKKSTGKKKERNDSYAPEGVEESESMSSKSSTKVESKHISSSTIKTDSDMKSAN
jgi:hypothetical protein